MVINGAYSVGVSSGQTYFMTVVTGPPPICPAFILPNTQARFKIPMDVLLDFTTGVVDVLGTSGRKLLQASVADSDGMRILRMASVGSEVHPRCVITMQLSGSSERQVYDVYGRDEQHYGCLERTATGDGLLKFAGPPFYGAGVMKLEASGSQGDLGWSAAAMDGRNLASAGRGARAEWHLMVQQGADAVLICSCMLALLALKPPAAAPGVIGDPGEVNPPGPDVPSTALSVGMPPRPPSTAARSSPLPHKAPLGLQPTSAVAG